MATSDWLDIHGHFRLDYGSEEEKQQTVEVICKNEFLISEAPTFDARAIIEYLDKAGVALQMLSYLPNDLDRLRAANDRGAELVANYPSRFGLLAALPTNNPDVCLEEIERVTSAGHQILPDGFAAHTEYNGARLSNPDLDPVWEVLNARKAVVFVHPYAWAPGKDGRPSPLIEVAFDTARTITGMIYNRVFSRFSDIKFVFAHSGGAFPVLAGRLELLGTESWVPNPTGVTSEEIKDQISNLYFDTAATAETGLYPAAKAAGIEHCVYGSDCGVPCSSERTMEVNRESVIKISKEVTGDENYIGHNAWELFPQARERASSAGPAWLPQAALSRL